MFESVSESVDHALHSTLRCPTCCRWGRGTICHHARLLTQAGYQVHVIGGRGESFHHSSRTRMTYLILIRHGETDCNVEGRYQSHNAPPLNTKGVADQAREQATGLRDVPLDVLITNPLRRAFQTAKILTETLRGLSLCVEPRFVQIHQRGLAVPRAG